MPPVFNPLKPLTGRTVAVACSKAKLEELSAGLEALGAQVLPFPVIELQALEDTRRLDDAVAALDTYDWIIFTSAHGVQFFMRRLKELRGRPSFRPKICALGTGTAKAVNEAGYPVELIPEDFIAEGVVRALEKYAGGLASLSGQRILIPRAKEGRDVIPVALSRAGVQVEVVSCYQNIKPARDEEAMRRIKAIPPDLLVFTSSSTVRNMIDILGPEDGKSMLLKTVVAVLGPVTGSTLESFGKRAEIVPRESTIASLLKEICVYCSSTHSTVDRQQ